MKSIVRPSYEYVWGHEVRKFLLENIPNLTNEQKKAIEMDEWEDDIDSNILTSNGYVVYKRRPKSKFSPFWRLTIGFFWIYTFLIVLFISPIKYLFTGSFHIGEKFYLKFYQPWERRV